MILLINVIIVDDELVVRVGIRSMIDWHQYGFDIVGEASDGAEAFEMIKSLKPDIVLTDIKMQQMDGITLLKKMKEIGFTGKSVILSCHNDFEFVKEALKLGATDYILKLSMQPQDLLNVMINTKEQLLAGYTEKTQLPRSSDFETNDWQKTLRNDVLYGTGQSGLSEADTSILTSGFYVATVSKIYTLQVQPRSDEEKKRAYDSALNFIQDVFSHNLEYDAFLKNQDELICLIRYSALPSEDEYLQLRHLIARFNNLIETYLNCIAVTGFEGHAADLQQINHFVEQAEKAANHGFYMKNSNIITVAELNYTESVGNTFGFSQIKKIYDDLRAKNLSHVTTDLKAFFDRLESECDVEPSDVIKTSKAIVNTFLMNIWNEYYLTEDHMNVELPTVNDIELTENLEQIKYMVFSGLDTLENLLNQPSANKYHKEMQRLTIYLKTHLNERITLDDAAIFTNLSRNYFCSVFKQEYGKTFNDYLTSMRIDMAKTLLSTTNLSVNEISGKAGYENVNYFFTLFKKYTSLSPQQFRKRGQKI